MELTSGKYSVPRELGIVLNVFSSGVSDDQIKAAIRIEVHAGTDVIAGTLSRADGSVVWRWRPDSGLLPAGTVHLKVTYDTSSAPATLESDVVIADQLVQLPDVQVPVTLERGALRGDPSAPLIQCSSTTHYAMSSGASGDECGGGGGSNPNAPPSTGDNISTAASYIANFEYALPSVSGGDQWFIRASYRVFGRDATGNEVEKLPWSEVIDHDPVVTQTMQFSGPPLAQYCVSVRTRTIADAAVTKRVDSCVPGAAIDMTVKPEDERAFVLALLQGCKDPVFPPGYSLTDPTRTDPTRSPAPETFSPGGGGCAVVSGGAAATGATGWALFVLASASLRRRIGRRRG